MKLAVSAKIYQKMSLEEIVEQTARIGYDAIEFRDNAEQLPLDTSMETIKKLKKHMRDAGLMTSSIASFTGMYATKTDEECAKELENLKKHLEMAAELGADNVRHWPSKLDWPSNPNCTEEHFERAAHWFRQACDLAAPYGVKLAIELHHNSLQDSTDNALKFYKMVGKNNLKFTPDDQNYYFDEEPMVSCIERLGKDLITNVHFKDVVKVESDVAPGIQKHKGKNYLFRPINMGGVDHYGTLDALKRVGYDSYVTVESDNLMSGPLELAEHEYSEMVKMMKELKIERH